MTTPLLADAPPPLLSPILEEREIVYFTGIEEQPTAKHLFRIVAINSPEQWVEAHAFTASYPMPVGDRIQNFSLRGVSLQDWSDANYAITVPEWDGEEGMEDAVFLASRNQAILHKQVLVFEKSFGKVIPGATPEEKIQFIEKRSSGELEALYTFIQHQLCNWKDANDLIPKYSSMLHRSTMNKTQEILSFEDWKEASEATYFFRMQRPGEDFICEFPLKAISQEQKARIDEETVVPEPPKVPVIHREGRPRNNPQIEQRPNRQDPKWLATVRAINEKRIVLYFKACLPFAIPGANEKEQYDWISQRLVGDVDRLKDYIEQELLSYGSRFHFFMNGQDQVA